jgi:para-nitrobenzyl esterase
LSNPFSLSFQKKNQPYMRLSFTTATLSLFIVLFGTALTAQNLCTAGRYVEPVFDCVDVEQNIPYGQGARNWSSTNILCQHGNLPPYTSFQTLLADVYEPCGDTETLRPLLIAIHGGAFASGNKADLAAFSTAMAKRGYVVASISYRLAITQNILCWNAEVDQIKFTRAFYRAMQDAKAAVRYFRANAQEYGIDPDNIFVGGHSAGAFTALGVGYLNLDSERPAATLQQSYCGNWLGQLLCNDLGGIEGEGGNPGVSSAVKGVISLAGALPELDYLNGPNDPPLLLVHGTADDVVPYNSGCVLQSLGPLFNTCINVFGSAPTYHYADSIGMDVQLLTLPNGGHGFTNAESDSIYVHASRFMCCRMSGGNCQTVSAQQDLTETAPIRVFPNPTSGAVTLQSSETGTWHALLFDMTGRLLERRTFSSPNAEFDLSGYPAGVYALRVQGGGRGTWLIKQ